MVAWSPKCIELYCSKQGFILILQLSSVWCCHYSPHQMELLGSTDYLGLLSLQIIRGSCHQVPAIVGRLSSSWRLRNILLNSLLLYHYLGKALMASNPVILSMVNCCMELEPLRARKPSNGILEVPITNYTHTHTHTHTHNE